MKRTRSREGGAEQRKKGKNGNKTDKKEEAPAQSAIMEEIENLFETTDLYAILKLDKDKASEPKARKSAYLKAAFAHHPDKGSEDEREIRTKQFQVIRKIYEVMENDDLRKEYDETGEWPGDEELNVDLDASAFRKLDEQMILEFKKEYVGSAEEKEDIIRHYNKGKGDILYVLDNLFFANILDDEDRVQGIIDELIESGKLKKIGGGVDAKAKQKKINKAKKEAKEAEKMKKDMKMGDGMDDLAKAIATRGAARSSFLDDLEKKYAGK